MILQIWKWYEMVMLEVHVGFSRFFQLFKDMSETNHIGSAGGFEYIDHLGFGFPGLFGCATSTCRTAIPVILTCLQQQ